MPRSTSADMSYYKQAGGGPTPMPLQFYNPEAVLVGQVGGRKAGSTRPLSEYNKFLSKEMKKQINAGNTPQESMKKAAKNWNKHKNSPSKSSSKSKSASRSKSPSRSTPRMCRGRFDQRGGVMKGAPLYTDTYGYMYQ